MSKPAIQRLVELLARLSLRAQYRLGNGIAWVVRRTSNQVSRQTRESIRVCFADAAPSERERLYRESIRHTCYTMTELGAAWGWPPERILAQITQYDICSEFEHSERGRIVLAPHLGSWETLAVWLGRSCQAMMLYKRMRNRRLETYISTVRARSGGTLVPTKKHGLRKLMIELREGGTLMILPDQRPAKNKARIMSTFWGLPAPTTTLVNNLCAKIDCDVFLAAAYRSTPPGEFGLRILPLQHARLAAEEEASAAYLNQQIEQLAREYVDQYQWGYRRFDDEVYASANG